MEEIIISPIIDSLIETLNSAAEEEVKFKWGVDSELTQLLKSFSGIQSLVADAEKKQFTSEKVKQWLLRLKNVVFDAEDITEEFVWRAVEAKMASNEDEEREEVDKQEKSRPESEKGKQVTNLCSCFCHSEVSNTETRESFKSLRKRVLRIENECRRLGLIETHKEEALNYMPENLEERATNFVALDNVFFLGREEDQKKLTEELVSSKFSGKGPSVIPILAPDGMGKTTLARLVFNSKEIEERFKIRWWFRASPDLNELKVIKEIYMDTFGYIYEGSTGSKLLFKDFVRRRRFLLVFDNVREDNPNWKMLLKPFVGRHKKSKIIITTRSEEVASVLGTDPPFRLEGLSRLDCAKLFAFRAFDAESFQRCPNLRQIGGRIVDKCGGCPLAVKALGGLLSDKRDETEWMNVLESATWNENANRGSSTAFTALQICYQNFSANSKLCFKYCSLFPRDYWYRDSQLVELWIGAGYVQDDECREREKAQNVFFDLVIKTFMSMEFVWQEEPRFRMHDIAQDLAEAVSGQEYVRIEEGIFKPIVNAQGARHSSFVAINEEPLVNLEELCKLDTNKKYHCLRSFVYLDMFHNKLRVFADVRGIFPEKQLELLLQCESLRVLSLQGSVIERFPPSIAGLKLLRFLDLSYSMLPDQLPVSVYKLYNLRTLDISHCFDIKEVPTDIKNLINLRHLLLWDESNMIEPLPYVGNLKKLQWLPTFGVSRDEPGYRISELKEMTDLKGLTIFNLQEVGSGEEAKEANMKNKRYLIDLTLEWWIESGDRGSSVDEEVLEALEPHTGTLKRLNITGYQGRCLASWVENLTSLKSLEVNSCPKLASLPEKGLPGTLQSLKIVSCPLLCERCKQETGEDWHKIEHIPQVIVE